MGIRPQRVRGPPGRAARDPEMEAGVQRPDEPKAGGGLRGGVGGSGAQAHLRRGALEGGGAVLRTAAVAGADTGGDPGAERPARPPRLRRPDADGLRRAGGPLRGAAAGGVPSLRVRHLQRPVRRSGDRGRLPRAGGDGGGVPRTAPANARRPRTRPGPPRVGGSGSRRWNGCSVRAPGPARRSSC